jgi:hypothetical protein
VDQSQNRKDYLKAYREAHKDEMKAYYKANKEKIKAYTKNYDKVYYEIHKDEKRTKNKAYRETHKEKMRAQSKAWHQTHKEKHKISCKIWQENNPDNVSAKVARRRAKKAGVVNLPIRTNILEYLLEIWNSKCAYCKNTSTSWHKDHFMPLNLKGHEAEYNLVLACPSCNCSKGSKHPFLFIKEQKINFTFKSYMKFPY